MPRGKKACRRRRAARAERRAVGSAPPGPRRVPGPQGPATAIAAYASAAQDSSSSSDVSPSQDSDGEDEDEDDGDDDGIEAFSQHSPTSPDTQNMPGAYPNLERLSVSDDGVGKSEGDESDDNAPVLGSLGSPHSRYPPDYDIELYGSVSSESEDEDMEGNQANVTNTAMRDGASVAETSGPHLTVSVQVRKKETEKKEEEEVVKENEVVKEKCPNWPHLPFRRPYTHATGHRQYSISHACNCPIPHITKSLGPDPLWEGGYSGSTKREDKNASLFAAKACGPVEGRVFSKNCNNCKKKVNHEARRF